MQSSQPVSCLLHFIGCVLVTKDTVAKQITFGPAEKEQLPAQFVCERLRYSITTTSERVAPELLKYPIDSRTVMLRVNLPRHLSPFDWRARRRRDGQFKQEITALSLNIAQKHRFAFQQLRFRPQPRLQ